MLETILNKVRRVRRSTIHAQVDSYIAWKSKEAPISAMREVPALYRFARFTDIRNVDDIEVRHIKRFEEHLIENESTQYAKESALRAVRGLLRYYHARGHICPSAKAVGARKYVLG